MTAQEITVCVVQAKWLTSRGCTNNGISVPAAEALKYKSLVFEYNSTFMTMEGNPTAETDLAWTDMQERRSQVPICFSKDNK
jgi:hypothetical protein